MPTFTQQLPGGARVARSRARAIRPTLREGERVQDGAHGAVVSTRKLEKVREGRQ
jgi:hypothetical protein